MDLKISSNVLKLFKGFWNRSQQNYGYVPYQKSFEPIAININKSDLKKQMAKSNLKNSFDDIQSLDSFGEHFNDDDNSHKISSTLIQISLLETQNNASIFEINDCIDTLSNAFSNEDYISPDVSFSQSANSIESNKTCSCYDSSSDSFESAFKTDDAVYVCCVDYQAQIQGDLNMKYADRVKLLHSNDDFALVENLINGKCGYVPTNSIKTLSEFLSQIKTTHRNY